MYGVGLRKAPACVTTADWTRRSLWKELEQVIKLIWIVPPLQNTGWCERPWLIQPTARKYSRSSQGEDPAEIWYTTDHRKDLGLQFPLSPRNRWLAPHRLHMPFLEVTPKKSKPNACHCLYANKEYYGNTVSLSTSIRIVSMCASGLCKGIA